MSKWRDLIEGKDSSGDNSQKLDLSAMAHAIEHVEAVLARELKTVIAAVDNRSNSGEALVSSREDRLLNMLEQQLEHTQEMERLRFQAEERLRASQLKGYVPAEERWAEAQPAAKLKAQPNPQPAAKPSKSDSGGGLPSA